MLIHSTSYAKWILVGEHSVIRGGKAIAFPLKHFKNCLTFRNNEQLLVHEKENDSTLLSLLHMAAEYVHISVKDLYGCFNVSSDIPNKVGLGSSAAICVNLARVISKLGYSNDTLSLARHLENKFHKRSSGLDIAVTFTGKPVVFHNGKITEHIIPSFWPHMILTYSGITSSTLECTRQVQNIFSINEKIALELDNNMLIASDFCEEALRKSNFSKLKEGINLAREMFEAWNLCNDTIREHIAYLFANGAVAAKPVGSGLGGYILSLWEENPHERIDNYLTLERP